MGKVQENVITLKSNLQLYVNFLKQKLFNFTLCKFTEEKLIAGLWVNCFNSNAVKDKDALRGDGCHF